MKLEILSQPENARKTRDGLNHSEPQGLKWGRRCLWRSLDRYPVDSQANIAYERAQPHEEMSSTQHNEPAQVKTFPHLGSASQLHGRCHSLPVLAVQFPAKDFHSEV